MRERCAKCGGRLDIELERWRREGRALERSYRCADCGSRYDSSVPWTEGLPPSHASRRGGRPFAAVAWLAVGMLGLWVLLRSMDYGTARVAVYSAVARAGEAFLHPAWAVALTVLAIAAFLFSRLGGRSESLPAAVAPSVRLRADTPEKLTISFSGSRGAVAHDAVLSRRVGEERRVIDAFQSLARRSVSFGDGGADGRTHWSREEIEDAQRELYALGLSIGEELLGDRPELAGALSDLPGDHLQLGVHGELAAVPWEILVPRKGGRFLWQLYSVTRQLLDEDPAGEGVATRPGARRMLLLANLESAPGRELAAAEREASELLELGATRPDLLRVVRKSPRDEGELRLLLKEGFDFVHFAGHSGVSADGTAGWTLGSGEAVSLHGLFPRGASPTVVFANACSSGAEYGGTGLASSARAVMMSGAGAYVCTLAELHDRGSAAFSGAFYRALARGETLGGALTSARSSLMGVHPFTWANYVLYGDPAARPLEETVRRTANLPRRR